MMKEKYDITGMSCAACAAGIEKNVRKVKGVKDLKVDLIGEMMWVEYDNSLLGSDDIINAVKKIGFGATLKSSEKPVEENIKTKDKEEVLPSEKNRLIFSIPLMLIVFYLAMGPMFHFPMPKSFLEENNTGLMALSQLIFTIPVMFLNRKYYIAGFRALKNKMPNMDSLVGVSSLAAFLLSLVYTYLIIYYLPRDINKAHHFTHELYYDSTAMILTLVTVGKYLEAKSKTRTKESLEGLINLAPKEAIILRDDKELTIKAKDISLNDTIIIKPGTLVPVDGVVIQGISAIDESALTGEPIPKEKSKGDTVYQGTTNTSGLLKIKALNIGEDTTLSQIVRLMEDTRASKAPIARLADKVSSVFVPIVMLISLLAFIVWWIVSLDFVFSLKIAISVLVISCPCALGLATPVAITIAVGKMSKEGVLIKSAEVLESLHEIDAIAFDKTGTLTEGRPMITEIHPNNTSEEELLKIALSLEKPSSHPLAEAVKERAYDILTYEVVEFNQVSGRGISGIIDGVNYYGGNQKYMEELGIEVPKYKGTQMYFAKEKNYLGALIAKDNLRPEAIDTIEKLKKEGVSIYLLTGDNEESAREIGEELGIEAVGGMLPKDKSEFIKSIKKKSRVLFIGDGINDALALTEADIGVALNNGTDIAIESAEVVLMRDDLSLLARIISYSKETFKIIRENLFFAFIYNVIGIPIAAGILYPHFGILLSPMIGAFAMAMSSVSVNLNALRLLKK